MKTLYLDEEIERLESFKNPIQGHIEQLEEYKAIKEVLSIHSVSGCCDYDFIIHLINYYEKEKSSGLSKKQFLNKDYRFMAECIAKYNNR